MSREPLFMQDLHRRQSKEYELTKRLTLQQFVEYINNKVKKRHSRLPRLEVVDKQRVPTS